MVWIHIDDVVARGSRSGGFFDGRPGALRSVLTHRFFYMQTRYGSGYQDSLVCGNIRSL